jgi:hypothetical protein
MKKGLLVLVLILVIAGGIFVFSPSVEQGSQSGPRRPSPEPSPRDPDEEFNCEGTRLSPGDDLADAIETERDEGVTFCLEAGTYEVPKDIDVQDGDQVIGAGMEQTFLEGAGAKIVIDAQGADDVLIRGLDISGGRGRIECRPMCGSGFRGGLDNRVESVRLHDNENHGIGGSEEGLTVVDSVLDHNGARGFLGCCAGGIKGGSGFVIRNSEIYSNTGNGIWCDSGCAGGFEVYDSDIYDNSRSGIRYEVSDDGAIIEDNRIYDNNSSDPPGGHGGIGIIASANARVVGNYFAGNVGAGIVINDTPRGNSHDILVRDNDLNGDDLEGCGASVVCESNR